MLKPKKKKKSLQPSLAAQRATPCGGESLLEQGKHETASGKLLGAWARGAVEGSGMEEFVLCVFESGLIFHFKGKVIG